MNKISMDAMNAGWNIGFGTPVRARDDDFSLLAATKAGEPQPKPAVVRSFFSRLTDQLGEGMILFSLRSA